MQMMQTDEVKTSIMTLHKLYKIWKLHTFKFNQHLNLTIQHLNQGFFPLPFEIKKHLERHQDRKWPQREKRQMLP